MKNINNTTNNYELYKTILQHAGDIIILSSTSGDILNVNNEAINSYGFTEKELLSMNICQLINANEIYLSKEQFKQSVSNKMSFITKHFRKDGSSFDVEIKSIYIVVDGQKYILSIVRDITERLRIQEENKNLTYIVENSLDAIIGVTSAGTIISWNKGAEKIFNFSKNEALGKNISLIISKEKYGDLLWLSSSISSIKDETGRIVKFLVFAKDIVKNEYFTEEITKKNDELKKALNSLKDLELHLVEEDKMASVGQLSAGIAHEINNPLGFVASNFNTLKKYMDKFKEYILEYKELKVSLPESQIEKINLLEQKSKIDYILNDLDDLYKDTDDGLERIKKIVVALKNFAHKNSEESFEDYNINQGIENTLVIAKNELKYDTDVKTNLTDNIPLIKANPSQINQVLLNIILNSSYAIKEKIKQTPIINGKLNISTWNDDDFVYCSIEDNGIGISEENINKIFNPFFTTKPIGKGTGLGLSISHDIIVNKHKGNIKCESKIGEGTKLTLIFPLIKKLLNNF